MKGSKGFSLLELMTAVVVVGILAAIAIPSYQNSVIKAHRRSAQTFLMDVAQKEAQYFLDARAYKPVTGNGNFASALNVSIPADVSSFYTVVVATTAVAGQPPTFTATATPIAGTKQASDVTLTLDNTGAKTPADKW